MAPWYGLVWRSWPHVGVTETFVDPEWSPVGGGATAEASRSRPLLAVVGSGENRGTTGRVDAGGKLPRGTVPIVGEG